jgi:restriction system protein
MWMIRNPGGHHASELQTNSIIGIGWQMLPENVLKLTLPQQFYQVVEQFYPDYNRQQVINSARQIYNFINEIKKDELVIIYDSERRIYLVGKISSDAFLNSNSSTSIFYIVKSVHWEKEISRDILTLPSRNSLGSTLTVFRPSEDTIAELLNILSNDSDEIIENSDPGIYPSEIPVEDPLENAVQNSRELIKDKLSKLSWQGMQELVAGILRAMGYKTKVSPAGSDRGKDIIASPDSLNLEHPRIFVEVKHRKGTIGSNEIRSFIGGRNPVNDRWVYVSSGGFTLDAKYEAERSSVPLTLVDIDDLVDLLIEYYDQTDVETRDIVPLKKTYWPI